MTNGGYSSLDVVFGIPSYKRAGTQRSLAYLERIGVPRDRILMSVQTEDDLNAYTAAGIKDRVGRLIYRPGRCCADNRNTLLDAVPDGTFMVLMDDDVKDVVRFERGKLVAFDTYESLMGVVYQGFRTAIKLNTVMFGLYLRANDFWMSSNTTEMTPRTIVIGQFIGRIVTPMRYDNAFETKDDYEICCRIIREYGALPRLNKYAASGKMRGLGGGYKRILGRRKSKGCGGAGFDRDVPRFA